MLSSFKEEGRDREGWVFFSTKYSWRRRGGEGRKGEESCWEGYVTRQRNMQATNHPQKRHVILISSDSER